MSKSQRVKGAVGEREVCAILSKYFGEEVKRNLGQARDSGDDITFGGITWEVKRRKSLATLYKWVQQSADAAAPKGTLPVVAFRADHEEWMVALPLSMFLFIAESFIRTTLAREDLEQC